MFDNEKTPLKKTVAQQIAARNDEIVSDLVRRRREYLLVVLRDIIKDGDTRWRTINMESSLWKKEFGGDYTEIFVDECIVICMEKEKDKQFIKVTPYNFGRTAAENVTNRRKEIIQQRREWMMTMLPRLVEESAHRSDSSLIVTNENSGMIETFEGNYAENFPEEGVTIRMWRSDKKQCIYMAPYSRCCCPKSFW